MARMKFVPEKGNLVDGYISKVLSKYPAIVKIERLPHNWYLFNGRIKLLLLIKGDQVVVRAGGGFKSLAGILNQIIFGLEQPKPKPKPKKKK